MLGKRKMFGEMGDKKPTARHKKVIFVDSFDPERNSFVEPTQDQLGQATIVKKKHFINGREIATLQAVRERIRKINKNKKIASLPPLKHMRHHQSFSKDTLYYATPGQDQKHETFPIEIMSFEQYLAIKKQNKQATVYAPEGTKVTSGSALEAKYYAKNKKEAVEKAELAASNLVLAAEEKLQPQLEGGPKKLAYDQDKQNVEEYKRKAEEFRRKAEEYTQKAEECRKKAEEYKQKAEAILSGPTVFASVIQNHSLLFSTIEIPSNPQQNNLGTVARKFNG